MHTRIIRPALLAGTIALLTCGASMAVTNVAGGNLDLNANGFPRLAPDTCYAYTRVDAKGRTNFPAAFRLFRDGVPVSADQETAEFHADNSTIDFRPGRYELVVVNKRPDRKLRVSEFQLECL
jgi:hypothetical protein